MAVPYTVVDGILLHHAAVAAHELGLYRALLGGSRTEAELARGLGLSARAVDLMAAAAEHFDLARRVDGRLRLTPTGRAALFVRPAAAGVEATPSLLLDLGARLLRSSYTYDALLAALRQDGSRGSDAFETWFGGEAAGFAAAMHEHALPVARRWPLVMPDLAEHHRLLDVGGGSGTHALAAVRAAPELLASVLELPAMAACAREAVAASGLFGRVRVVGRDMWDREPWPDADLHLLADVLHDWRPALAQDLASRSFAELPRRGRLALLEMAADARTPDVVGSSLGMLLLTGGQQYTLAQLRGFLAGAGFVDVEARLVIGPWHLILGRKP